MPNWVYNSIEVEEEYTDRLKEIAKEGICNYLKPQPKAYDDTISPVPKRKDNPYIYDLSMLLKKHHGHTDWYNWRYDNWGVKWDAVDGEVEDNIYRFQTPWDTPDISIFELLAEKIPNFSYYWEEEQGFGALWHCVDGKLELEIAWDLPPWKDTTKSKRTLESMGIFSYLSEDFTNMADTHKKGYYLEYDLNTPLGLTYSEALKKYNKYFKKDFNETH